MTINLGEYTFNGPFTDPSKLSPKSGLYAIHCKRNDKYYRVDVGESNNVKDRVENHDRKDCWNKECKDVLTYSELLTPRKRQAGRKKIEKEIRDLGHTPCGKE